MSDYVYLLYHIRNEGELLLVGAYRSEKDAKAAIERLKDKPGFAQHPSGFEYHAYELGVDIWSEGFTDDESDTPTESQKKPN
ncbi:MAG TPA: hypothetical protein VIH76_18790 [Candidatus Acidoferrales bacterium]